MGTIRILPKEVVNKIAAGEVVERPASVVKELVENALDAGADAIIIEIKAGGKDYIRVTDNGSGMDAEDLFLSYAPHATSKLATDDDLFSVTSLGFRGEALSSIAAVSRVSIASRPEGEENGKEITVEGGVLRYDTLCGMPVGTRVTVEELFFNTPARKKHLQGDSAEQSHILDIAMRYALSREDMSVILVADGKEVLNIPKGRLLDKIFGCYGKEFARHMIPIAFRGTLVDITGFIGKPYLAKKDRSYQSVFVNGRYVKSQTISNAIYDAYHTLLFLDRHPACVLMVDIDTRKTDVNVHPQKEVIRIEEDARLYEETFAAVRESLQKNDLIPEVTAQERSYDRKPTKQYAIIKEKQELLAPAVENVKVRIEGQPLSAEAKARMPFGHLRILGQLNRLYIVAEGERGLVLIDQHAAQERCKYEALMEEYQNKSVQGQELLSPELIELPLPKAVIVRKNMDVLSTLGFGIEEYGKNTFRVTRVPRVLGGFTKSLLFDTIEELGQSKNAMEESVEERIAKKACRASVKAGESLTEPAMRRILDELSACQKPYSCPHGRPTMITVTLSELEQKFKRTG